VEKLTLLLVVLFVPFVLALCYMTPATVALRRHHPRHDAIRKLNLLFGWTIIGWCVALIWSLRSPEPVSLGGQGFLRPAEPHLSLAPRAMNEVWVEIEVTDTGRGDGVERASLVDGLRPGDMLQLERVTDTAEAAVRVCLADGRQIGVLDSNIAARVAMNLDGNRPVDCRVRHLTGGDGLPWRLEAILAFHVLRTTPRSDAPSTAPTLTASASG